MALTKAETKQRAAELLKIVPIAQAMENQDDVRMGEAYDIVYAKLQINGTAIFPDSALPDEFSTDFIYLMADEKIDLYPVSDNLYARIKNHVGPDQIFALNRIRRNLGDQYEDLNEAVDY